ncbi:hypothetical protein Landi51_13442 [Colletotrichum acutatum]
MNGIGTYWYRTADSTVRVAAANQPGGGQRHLQVSNSQQTAEKTCKPVALLYLRKPYSGEAIAFLYAASDGSIVNSLPNLKWFPVSAAPGSGATSHPTPSPLGG